MPEGNPAARLHHVLHELSSRGEQAKMARILSTLATYKTPTSDGAGDVEPTPPTEAELLQLFGALVALPNEARVAIDRLPGDDSEDLDLLRAPLAPIEQALRQYGLNGLWKQYKTKVTPEVLTGLRHLAQALRRNGYHEDQVVADELARLQEHVADLFEETRTAPHLDEELRRFVLRHLDRIERGIRHYQVEGRPPLEDAVDLFLGDMVRDSGESDRRGLRRFIEEDALGRQLLRLLGEVNGALTLAQWTIGAAAGIPLPPVS